MIGGLPATVLPVLGSVDRRRLREQASDLSGQLLLPFAHVVVAHRLVLGCVRLHLRPVQGHVAQLHQASLLAQLEYLEEQVLQCLQVTLAKGGDGVVIRMLVAGQEAERHVLEGCALHPAGREDAHAVAVDQQSRHHLRMVGRLAATITVIPGKQRRQVQFADHLGDKPSQMALWQPVPEIRRQQKRLAEIECPEAFHADYTA